MANHNLPTLTSTYAAFATELDARFDDLAVGLDPAVTTATNVPSSTVRWTSASNKWQKYNGTTWDDLTNLYAINISGNSATATTLATPRNINGVAFNGSAGISINLNNGVTFNSSGTGATSGAVFTGSGATTISYNTIGAPSTAGTNATGTWGINITGNAATATSATSAGSVTNGVYTAGDQTIAGNKTFTGVIGIKTVSETVYDLGTGTLLTPINGTIQTRTITANTTFTEALQSGQSLVLNLTNASLYTITWPTIKWARSVGNVAPTFTTLDTVVLWKINTVLYGAYVGSSV